MTAKQRLDQLLVDLAHFPSRARARDAILRGTVEVNGTICNKPAQKVSAEAELRIDDPATGYVSRAALKLLAGLDVFPVSVANKVCLDIGASTGGFTQVLLEKDAKLVHAIDVGHDQLHPKISEDTRVHRKDGLNARDLTLEDLNGIAPDILVSDVSFISLTLALPPALGLAAPGACGIFLVKPQFEAGRENIGKGGLVAEDIALETAERLQSWLSSVPGWKAGDLVPSPIKGGDGNREWLLYGQKIG